MRVSTKDQNLERQEIAIKQFRPEIPEHNIFCDKEMGKEFDRIQYQAMKVILDHVVKVNGNNEIIEVIFKELDRLGRNADGIKQELQWFKERGICVRILEVPTTLVDIPEGNELLINMITAILIEVYSVIAQQELEKRAQRQTEGIAAAQAKLLKSRAKTVRVRDLSELQRSFPHGSCSRQCQCLFRRIGNEEASGNSTILFQISNGTGQPRPISLLFN